ncbi:MAG: hypothetical protein ACOVOW_14650 [Spirosomataceae bacterium]|jgi:hypothetical protein
MENTYLSFEDAKLLYPDEWLLLGNPVKEEFTLLGGILLYHSKDKKEVCYLGRDKTEGFERIKLVFTGKSKGMRKMGIMRRV